jgi:tripartite-type tricarboxylate transporter receptor subunit TctC
MFTKRQFLKAAVALPALGARPAFAQAYPSRPIKIIVPASPGTSIDMVTRFFSESLSKKFGVAVIVENKPGAGGVIAYSTVAKSPPDGYTLILTGTPLYLLPLFSEQATAPYDAVKDFVPIARVARVPYAIVVGADSPLHTMSDLIGAMKKSPGHLTYSSQGVGSSAHLCSVVLGDMSQTKAQHIGYKETTTAVTDVVADRINFTCQTSVGVLPLVRSGKLRALAVTSASRWESLPDVPTVAESAIKGFEISSQLDFMAPAGTPDSVLDLLSSEMVKVADTQAFKQFCSQQILTREIADYKTLRPVLAKEAARWQGIVDLAKNG